MGIVGPALSAPTDADPVKGLLDFATLQRLRYYDIRVSGIVARDDSAPRACVCARHRPESAPCSLRRVTRRCRRRPCSFARGRLPHRIFAIQRLNTPHEPASPAADTPAPSCGPFPNCEHFAARSDPPQTVTDALLWSYAGTISSPARTTSWFPKTSKDGA
jgi:hypothetical protein